MFLHSGSSPAIVWLRSILFHTSVVYCAMLTCILLRLLPQRLFQAFRLSCELELLKGLLELEEERKGLLFLAWLLLSWKGRVSASWSRRLRMGLAGFRRLWWSCWVHCSVASSRASLYRYMLPLPQHAVIELNTIMSFMIFFSSMPMPAARARAAASVRNLNMLPEELLVILSASSQ